MQTKMGRETEISYYTYSNFKQITTRRFLIILIGIFLFLWVYLTIISCKLGDPVQVIFIESEKAAIFETSPKFLSIALDAIVIANGFKDFNMTDPKLIAMIKFLSPGYLRIGGNLADRITFSSNNETNKDSEDFYKNFENITNVEILPNITLTASNWLQLYMLANKTDMEIFFCLNALQRSKNGPWDAKNAQSMIKFSNEHGLKLNWELGNEPNSYLHKFKENVTAKQLAQDFGSLRKILNTYSNYKRSLLVGPDVTRPQENKQSVKYLTEFIQNGKNNVDKISWHQYYLNGHNTTPDDFLDPKVYDLLKSQISVIKNITSYTGKSIWLGETSSAYGGGAPNMSDRFIGSFLWVDKLGLAAKMGVEVIMRQSIFHGDYALLDMKYNPNPDWWISIIYKAVVGTRVVPFVNITSPGVRLYAHCTNAKKNSITIFGLNVGKDNAKVAIEGLNFFNNAPQYAYVFQLQTRYLDSKHVYCNGKLLKMKPGNQLPTITAVEKDISSYLNVPPFSIIFWIVPNVTVKACF